MKFKFYLRLMILGFFGLFMPYFIHVSYTDLFLLAIFAICIVMFISGFILSLLEVIKEEKSKKDVK